jgi:outer membrane protein OmpA-like peptidoglycan-associated protein
MTGSVKIRHLASFALGAALVLAPALPSNADPLSPVTDTVKTVTGATGQTLSGAGRAAGNAISAADRTVATTTTATPQSLGLPDARPEGIATDSLGGTILPPAPAATSSPRSPDNAGHDRDITQPPDAYLTSIPDVLPRGTLARIYFEPGETSLDTAAENRIAGFVQNFRQRIGNVDIKGYADRASGDDARASDIALARALAVQEALLAQGVAAGRLRASTMGNVEEGGALEDRVDIRFDGY